MALKPQLIEVTFDSDEIDSAVRSALADVLEDVVRKLRGSNSPREEEDTPPAPSKEDEAKPPRRTRRTKAQIEADNAAAQAAAPPDVTQTEGSGVTAQDNHVDQPAAEASDEADWTPDWAS